MSSSANEQCNNSTCSLSMVTEYTSTKVARHLEFTGAEMPLYSLFLVHGYQTCGLKL